MSHTGTQEPLKSVQQKPGIVKLALLCFIFVVLWNSALIVAKYGMGYVGPITLLAYRYVLVVAILIVVVSVAKSWRRVSAGLLASHACIGILSHAVFLGSGEHTSYRQWAGLALGVSAVLLVVSDKIALNGSAMVYTLPFVAVFALSIASLMDRRILLIRETTKTTATPLSLICLIHCTSALVVLIPAAVVLEQFEIHWGFEVVISILWLTIFVSIGSFWLMFYLLRCLSATRVASLGYLGPPVTMLMGYMVFNEKLGPVDLAGLLLAGCAVWLVLSKSGVRHGKTETAVEKIPANYATLANAHGTPVHNFRQQTQLDRRNQLTCKCRVKLNRFSKQRSESWLYEDTYRNICRSTVTR